MTSKTSRRLGLRLELAIQLMACIGFGSVLLSLVRFGQYFLRG